MYAQENQVLISTECCLSGASHGPHTHIDMVPVEANMVDEVIMYFRQVWYSLGCGIYYCYMYKLVYAGYMCISLRIILSRRMICIAYHTAHVILFTYSSYIHS